MNEKEKDSIEILKNTDLDVNTIDLVDLHTYNYAVKTVLNLLEKKDTLIYTMQSEFERLEDLEDNTDMLKMELEKKDIDIIEAKEANRQLSIELQKKDKIIDEMTEWIEKNTKYYDEDGCYCEVEKDICNKTIDCKDCIKQYYERKVESEN